MEKENVDKRIGYLSRDQRECLVKLVLSDPELANGKFSAAFTYKIAQRRWEEIAKAVNALPGGKKDWKHWRKTWQYVRTSVKAKKSFINRHMKRTGGGPPTDVSLDTAETAVLVNMNPISIRGHQQSTESEVVFDFSEIENARSPSPRLDENQDEILPYYGNRSDATATPRLGHGRRTASTRSLAVESDAQPGCSTWPSTEPTSPTTSTPSADTPVGEAHAGRLRWWDSESPEPQRTGLQAIGRSETRLPVVHPVVIRHALAQPTTSQSETPRPITTASEPTAASQTARTARTTRRTTAQRRLQTCTTAAERMAELAEEKVLLKKKEINLKEKHYAAMEQKMDTTNTYLKGIADYLKNIFNK